MNLRTTVKWIMQDQELLHQLEVICHCQSTRGHGQGLQGHPEGQTLLQDLPEGEHRDPRDVRLLGDGVDGEVPEAGEVYIVELIDDAHRLDDIFGHPTRDVIIQHALGFGKQLGQIVLLLKFVIEYGINFNLCGETLNR